jgi:prepilin-type N-terminal cleavage/methylation domain-containing protein
MRKAFTLIEPFDVAHGKLLVVRPFGKRKRPAFTLIELLVVIAIIAVLVTILVPVIMDIGPEADRVVCTKNLQVIGKAYHDYAYSNPNDPFPRHVDSPTALAGANTGPTGAPGSDALAGAGDCSMNTVWVLIASGLLTNDAFHCPGDEGFTARMVATKYGWANATEFSYGVHYPYEEDPAGGTPNPADPAGRYSAADGALNPPAKKGDWMYLSNWVIMADRNPGGAVDGAAIEHSNHKGVKGGCAVVTRIGNVIFYEQETSSMAGFGDDIYTDAAGLATAAAFPQNRSDTVISPTVARP